MRLAVHSRKWTAIALTLGLSLALGGCLETLPQPAAKAKPETISSIAPRPGVSPSGASISFVSLAGAPDNVRKQLGDAMTGQVNQRNLSLAGAQSAHYLIRGSISATAGGQVTRISYVWDIYDARKRFRQRLQDSVVIAAVAQDGWSLVDAKVTADIAARSVRELSAFLSHTPEAIAAAKSSGATKPASPGQVAAAVKATGAVVRSATSQPGVQLLSYAPLR